MDLGSAEIHVHHFPVPLQESFFTPSADKSGGTSKKKLGWLYDDAAPPPLVRHVMALQHQRPLWHQRKKELLQEDSECNFGFTVIFIIAKKSCWGTLGVKNHLNFTSKNCKVKIHDLLSCLSECWAMILHGFATTKEDLRRRCTHNTQRLNEASSFSTVSSSTMVKKCVVKADVQQGDSWLPSLDDDDPYYSLGQRNTHWHLLLLHFLAGQQIILYEKFMRADQGDRKSLEHSSLSCSSSPKKSSL